MSRRWLGVIAVAVIAAGIIALKQRAPDAASAGGGPTVPPATPTVLLFADPGEAGASCGCGQIIRLVRAAAGPGLRVEELDPRRDAAEAQRYAVRVQPTVVILDRGGRETERFEGEAQGALKGLRAALGRLTPRRP